MKPSSLAAPVLAAFTLAAPLSATAAPPSPTPVETANDTAELARRFDSLLETIEVVPNNRQDFERAMPDVKQRLIAAASDVSRTTWQRVRAVSLLSYFPDVDTRSALERLSVAPDRRLGDAQRKAQASADPEVRRLALYTLGRAYGAQANEQLVAFIEAQVAAEPELSVQEHAVRGLRWVDHPAAKAALTRLSERGPAALRELARATAQRRDARLASPRFGH